MSKACTIGAPEGAGSSDGSSGSGKKNVEPINDGSPSRYYPPGVSKGTKGRGKKRIVQTGDRAEHQKPRSSSDSRNSSLYSLYDDDGQD